DHYQEFVIIVALDLKIEAIKPLVSEYFSGFEVFGQKFQPPLKAIFLIANRSRNTIILIKSFSSSVHCHV
ncbi:MAG: hypothetical protein ACTJER_02345, partial [Lacticaseibacillus paracasei]